MRIKLFSCHHEQPIIGARHDMFTPIWIGGKTDHENRWLSDLDGLNIFSLTDIGDMRHQFFVWKNHLHGADYIGFEQYRRLFLIDPYSAQESESRYPRVFKTRRDMAADSTLWRADVDAETFVVYVRLREELDEASLLDAKTWISGYDLIIPRRLTHAPVDAQWSMVHSPEIWPKFVEAVNLSSFWSGRKNFINFSQVGGLFCNMFIMKTHLFSEYMMLWLDVMFSMYSRVDRSTKNLAYLSERLFSYWVMQKQVEEPLLRIAELPYAIPDNYELAKRLMSAMPLSLIDHEKPTLASNLEPEVVGEQQAEVAITPLETV